MDHVAFTGPRYRELGVTTKRERIRPYPKTHNKALLGSHVPTIDVVDFHVGPAYRKNTLHFFLQDVQRFAARGGGPCTLPEDDTAFTVVWNSSQAKGLQEKFFGKLIRAAEFLVLIGAEYNIRIETQEITLVLADLKPPLTTRKISEEEEKKFRILQCIHFASVAGKFYYAWINAGALASYENLHWLCFSSAELVTLRKVVGETYDKDPSLVIFAKSMLYSYMKVENEVSRTVKRTRYSCWTFNGANIPSTGDIGKVMNRVRKECSAASMPKIKERNGRTLNKPPAAGENARRNQPKTPQSQLPQSADGSDLGWVVQWQQPSGAYDDLSENDMDDLDGDESERGVCMHADNDPLQAPLPAADAFGGLLADSDPLPPLQLAPTEPFPQMHLGTWADSTRFNGTPAYGDPLHPPWNTTEYPWSSSDAFSSRSHDHISGMDP